MAERNDEIDLLELFAKFVLLIKRNTIIIILAFFIGGILGFVHFQFSRKVYESKMILLSDILTSSYSERITESLDRLISENNIKILSERLKSSEEDARKIVKIQIESVKQNKAKDEKENEIFIVTVRVVDKSILPTLQENIVSYLRNNEFVKIRVAQRKTYATDVIGKIDEQLVDLEQLKARISKGELAQGSKENMVLFDPTTVHGKILELNKERTTLQNSLETINSIQLVEGFTVFENPVSPKLLYSLSGGASLGLFFVALVIAFKVIRKMLNFSEQKLEHH